MDKDYQDKIGYLQTSYIDVLGRYLATKDQSVVKGSQLMNAHSIVYQLGDRAPALYNFFMSTLTNYNRTVALRQIQEKQGKWIITEFAVQWENYTILAYWLAKAFQYLERNYLQGENKPTLCQTALTKFQEEVFMPVIKTIVKTLFDELEAERSGELLDWVKVKKTLHCFRSMGMKQAKILKDDKGDLVWAGEMNLDFYKRHFEGEFITQSTTYYKQESHKWITSMSCPEFVSLASNALKKEEEKAMNFLDPATRPKLLKLVEDEVLLPYAKVLTDMDKTGLVTMLKDKRTEELKAMAKLFARRPETIPHIIAKLGPYIHERGTMLKDDETTSKDPVVYMAKLVDLKEEIDRLVEEAFNNGDQYCKVRDGTFVTILDEFPSAAFFLGEYIDYIMTQGLRGKEAEMETILDCPFALFRLLKSKDAFTKRHQELYAQRLLKHSSISDIAEELFISKMKIELGAQYVAKYVQMGQDIRTSAEETKQFLAQLSKGSGVDLELTAKILTNGLWTLKPNTHCKLPQVLTDCTKKFEAVYKRHHTGKNLMWSATQGDCEITAHLLKKPYTLLVSVYQATILDAFNQQPTYTYSELQKETLIPEDQFNKEIFNLINPKMGAILQKVNKKSPKCTPDEPISWNAGFAFSSLRVSLQPVVVRKDPGFMQDKITEENKQLNKERAVILQTIIVKIMKGRKKERHANLMDETVKQCIAFHPDPMMIKAQIEWLIENDYLMRDSADKSLYIYKP
jgi:hypothetical protein